MKTKTAVPTEDILLTTLQEVWQDVSCPFDVVGPMPDPAVLFDDARLGHPREAAEQVMVNMLLEVMECVDRFSPWYTRPARDFGLTAVLDEITCQVSWGLNGKGAARWRSQLDDLCAVIQKHGSLIEAMLLVDGLLTAVAHEDALILAQCHCLPCRYIRVKKSILRKTEIICDICHQAFFPTDDYPAHDFRT